MCLVTTKSRSVATDDIVCYKVMLGNRTPYRKAFVNFEKPYFTATGDESIESNPYNTVRINGGFVHTFKTLDGARCEKRCFDSVDIQIWKCIIPQGTEYFEGKFMGIEGFASKKIKFIETAD